MPPAVVGEWSFPLLRASARSVVCDYSKAALRAMVVVSQHSELHLRATLVLTNTLALYLSALLSLNAALRRALAAVVYSAEEPEVRPAAFSTCPWRTVLLAVPELCRCLLAVCVATAALLAVTLSSLLNVFKDSGAHTYTLLTVCDCAKTLLSTFHTVTVHYKNVLGTVCDFSN